MDINELKAKIDMLNKRSAKVNTVRNQNIGKRETLKAQCAELFKQYQEKYGVSLTPDTIDAEIEKVTSDKMDEVTKLENVLAAVDAGDYNHANALLGIEYQDEAIKNALSSKGANVDRVTQSQEIMNRNFNEVAPETSVAEPEGTTSAEVAETEVVEHEDSNNSEQVAQPTPNVAKPGSKFTNAFDFAKTFDDDVVAPPPVAPPTAAPIAPSMPNNTEVKPPNSSESDDVMSMFTKPSQPQQGGGLFGIPQPTPEPPKKNTNASFEAMFGGGQFHGGK